MSVNNVTKEGELYNIEGLDKNGKIVKEGYDYIILAVPLHQHQNISIEGGFSFLLMKFCSLYVLQVF